MPGPQCDSNNKPRAQPLGTAVDELGLCASPACQPNTHTSRHDTPVALQPMYQTSKPRPDGDVFATPRGVAQRTTAAGRIARQCSTVQPGKIGARDLSVRPILRWTYRMQGRSYSLLNPLVWKSPSCGEGDVRQATSIIVPASLAASPFGDDTAWKE